MAPRARTEKATESRGSPTKGRGRRGRTHGHDKDNRQDADWGVVTNTRPAARAGGEGKRERKKLKDTHYYPINGKPATRSKSRNINNINANPTNSH